MCGSTICHFLLVGQGRTYWPTYREKRLSTSASPVPLIQKSVHLPIHRGNGMLLSPCHHRWVVLAKLQRLLLLLVRRYIRLCLWVTSSRSVYLFPGHFVGTHLRYPYREGSPIHSANAHWQCRKSSGTAVAKFPLLILHVPMNNKE